MAVVAQTLAEAEPKADAKAQFPGLGPLGLGAPGPVGPAAPLAAPYTRKVPTSFEYSVQQPDAYVYHSQSFGDVPSYGYYSGYPEYNGYPSGYGAYPGNFYGGLGAYPYAGLNGYNGLYGGLGYGFGGLGRPQF